jgi:hypothetical protein
VIGLVTATCLSVLGTFLWRWQVLGDARDKLSKLQQAESRVQAIQRDIERYAKQANAVVGGILMGWCSYEKDNRGAKLDAAQAELDELLATKSTTEIEHQAKGKELAQINKDLGDEEASRNRIQDHLRLRESRERVDKLSKEVAKAKKDFEGK